MKKTKLIIILSLVLTLTILISVPTNAMEGFVKGAKGEAPDGNDTCFCEYEPFSCYCYIGH